jgi:hydrogenase maturation protein HypF
MWLEHLARGAASDPTEWPCRFTGTEIDWRETLAAVIDARVRGLDRSVIARAFHRGLARAVAGACIELAAQAGVDTVALSGGVVQNDLLLGDIRDHLRGAALRLWVNRTVPANDGGISLGQAAIAALGPRPGDAVPSHEFAGSSDVPEIVARSLRAYRCVTRSGAIDERLIQMRRDGRRVAI